MTIRQTPRCLEQCPHRRTMRAAADRAVCELLREISGVEESDMCLVPTDVCRACCAWFPPSATDINPVIASLLYGLSSRIISLEGVPGCSGSRADRLNQRAAENLPSDEDMVGAALDERWGETTVSPPAIERIIPPPARRSGPWVRNWAVGVTTAPRRAPTLEECLDSLAIAGWPRPRLFVDGEVAIPNRFSALPVTPRHPRMGAWPSYYLALGELLMREPDADAYLLVQDDVLFFPHPQLRSYLERVLWPGRRAGIASLFCSRGYTQSQPGWRRYRGVWTLCALAFVFSRQAAQGFLADKMVVEHRWSPDNRGLANIDWLIGAWAHRHRVPICYPTPSIVQHIGHVSTLWANPRAFGDRCASWFAGGPSAPFPSTPTRARSSPPP